MINDLKLPQQLSILFIVGGFQLLIQSIFIVSRSYWFGAVTLAMEKKWNRNFSSELSIVEFLFLRRINQSTPYLLKCSKSFIDQYFICSFPYLFFYYISTGKIVKLKGMVKNLVVFLRKKKIYLIVI